MFIHSLNIHLLSTYYMAGTILCAVGQSTEEERQGPCLHGAYMLVGERDNEEVI